MKTYTSVREIRDEIQRLKSAGKKLSFAPTMGALHEGHLSLIEIAEEYGEISVASIFVNPSQFNNPEDLKKYPRMLEKDSHLLSSKGCDILFAPSVEEIYPIGLDTRVDIDLNELEKPMEGEFRPGHFQGMMQVVNRLLDIVEPHYLIMGQKDFQQFTIVGHMIEKLSRPIKLIIAPTLREKDGLAMSSRNLRLSPEMREISPVIYETLCWVKENINRLKVDEICNYAMYKINNAGLKSEYFRICNGKTLKPVKDINIENYVVACLAAYAGDIRLIDNMILKQV